MTVMTNSAIRSSQLASPLFAAALLVLVLLGFGAPAQAQSPVLISGSVFLDDDHDNSFDSTEAGVDGVVVTVYDAMFGYALGSVVSGDTADPAWDDCVLQNPGKPLQGLYCFEVPGWSYYYAEVVASNFGSGQPLEGLGFTGGGNTRLELIYDSSALGLDLGYHEVPGVGNTVDWEALYDSGRWPFASNYLGGAQRSASELNGWLEASAGNDRSIALMQQQIAGVLNVYIGNDPSCSQSTLAAANQWLANNPPGSGVGPGSAAWKNGGSDLYDAMQAYNEGDLCASSRTDL
jgi:hypothetical protein